MAIPAWFGKLLDQNFCPSDSGEKIKAARMEFGNFSEGLKHLWLFLTVVEKTELTSKHQKGPQIELEQIQTRAVKPEPSFGFCSIKPPLQTRLFPQTSELDFSPD